jgi:hypothetical protein
VLLGRVGVDKDDLPAGDWQRVPRMEGWLLRMYEYLER